MHLRTAIAIALLAAGCNDSADGDSNPANNSSLADDTVDCTTDLAQALTWDSWAHGFFLSNCTSCHSSALQTEDERQKAPPEYNYDTYEGVVENAVDIEYRVVTMAGDTGLSMPPNIDLGDERETLRIWIECGLKQH